MNIGNRTILLGFFILGITGILAFAQNRNIENDAFISHVIDLNKQNLKFYWKDDKGDLFRNFNNLKKWVNSKNESLIFAMNGGMYKKDRSPQGLFIEKGVLKSKIDTLQNGYGNFYLQPNGIFYITNKNKGVICKTTNFKIEGVEYATQSGPLLLIDGKIHHKFRNGSKNLNIRNGVGILSNGSLIFAMSKNKINFYDFATYFKNLGCKNALYLDGFVSKTYLPSKNETSIDGNFGIIIAETKKRK